MFTDNKDFYPTPEKLIHKMLSDVDFNYIKTILEPSAGKGNIVDVLENEKRGNGDYYYQNHYKWHFDVDCIEKDDNLRSILIGKDYKVIYNDFLSFQTFKEYDLIIMNPPFSDGCKHLLKALELQERNGGAIICLLNAETLKNPCNNDRIALKSKLEEYNANIEYITEAFRDAERKTDVEIALIKVKLPEVKKESFIFENLKKKKYTEEKENNNQNKYDGQIVENDFLKAIISQYNMEIEAGINFIKEYERMKPLILSSFGKDEKTGETIQTGGCIINLSLSDRDKDGMSINNFIRCVRSKYWNALLHNDKFTGQLTENLRRDFYNQLEKLQDYDFNMYNISELKLQMNQKVIKGIEETIISLFDELSAKYSYYDEMSKNIHYYNGWKTNQAWIINKKVIIPLNGFRDLAYSWGRYAPTDYKVINKLKDIEKCLNYLDGGLTTAVDLVESLKEAKKNEVTKNIRLKYFDVTFYKKGTCHITFTCPELLKKFNIFGSQQKGWLPPSYGKKSYNDMDKEEQEVIKEFEGEKSYMETMQNVKYYIFNRNNMKLLEG